MSALMLATLILASRQSSVPSEARRHAIVGARIEIGNGQVIEKGTLVIDNGIITAVGRDASIPAGTLVLDGAGLTLTPGFIDAWTSKGLALPPAVPDQDASPSIAEYAPANMREANRKGVRPELQARTLLALTDDVLKPYRAAGFTSAMLVPAGGYLGGVGALANLGGRPARDSVLVPQSVLSINFDGEADGGNYPGSLLGRVAQVRQALFDAQWRRTVLETYRQGGATRPPSDPTLEALDPFLDRLLPVGLVANSPSEIDRALALSREFNIGPWLVGGLQAYRRIEDIKKSGAPIILALNFGEEPPAKGLEEEPARLAERKRIFNEAAGNAAALAKAEISLVMTSRGCKDPEDFLKHLRLAVAAGFSRDSALKALTSRAAALFGMDSRLGTLEVGKIANIVARDGDFLNEKTKVKMLYIDGRRIDPTAKPLPPGQKPAPVRDGGDR